MQQLKEVRANDVDFFNASMRWQEAFHVGICMKDFSHSSQAQIEIDRHGSIRDPPNSSSLQRVALSFHKRRSMDPPPIRRFISLLGCHDKIIQGVAALLVCPIEGSHGIRERFKCIIGTDLRNSGVKACNERPMEGVFLATSSI